MPDAVLFCVRVGIRVHCDSCDRMKKPVGRSAPLGGDYCDDACACYRLPPHPGSLWPGETETAFGYPVGDDGTVRRDAC